MKDRKGVPKTGSATSAGSNKSLFTGRDLAPNLDDGPIAA